MGITYAELGCRNLSASLDFYRGMLGLLPAQDPPGPTPPGVAWLDAGPAALRLVERPDGDLAGWDADDLQRGIRHVGFKVGNVPAYAQRLADAGIEFTLGPLKVTGDVWIAFFPDPDGANLEIIDSALTYTTVASPDLADQERLAAARRAPDAGPSFDHVAITVADLDRALAFYRDRLGYRLIGTLVQPTDPRGLRIHYLRAGAAVLEIFTFTAPTTPNPWTPDTPRVGLRTIGLGAEAYDTENGAREIAVRLRDAGATPVPGYDDLLTDPDGVLLCPWWDRPVAS
ncbi:VOC family protein [Thermopolyspora sp. NPDC052614]|uniref:VOC family protein n=1 Tax=Thermopolyspora sp. NPDC052614 TaxID=3155682 RepID=UPI00343779D3